MKSKLMFSIRSPGNAFVEGDASSASYFLAGAAVTGGTITVNGCGTNSLQVFMLDTIFYYLLFYGLYCIIPNSTPFFSLSPHFQKNRAYHCILNSSCMSFFVSWADSTVIILFSKLFFVCLLNNWYHHMNSHIISIPSSFYYISLTVIKIKINCQVKQVSMSDNDASIAKLVKACTVH